MVQLFVTLIYQPFLNLLVFVYWLLDIITGGNGDMGIAVIILAVIIRILLLPLSFNGQKTEGERRNIAEQVTKLESDLATDPVLLKAERKKILSKSRLVIMGEMFTFCIQLMIILMLYRMFGSGLSGEDIPLLYSFMPDVGDSFNLVFLGKYDLTAPSLFLNFVQSLSIFVLETLVIFYSPYPVSKSEVVRMQLVYPVVAFFLFLLLPSGKKLFIITTIIFSIVLTIVKIVRWKFSAFSEKKITEELEPTTEESVVVDVK